MSVIKHTIAPGECLNSLAAEFGCSVDNIRELEGNEELMEKRPHSGCFNPGDQVYIPQPNGEFTINDGEELELVVGEGSFDLPIRLLDNNLDPLSDVTVRCIGTDMLSPVEQVTDSTGEVIFSLPLSVKEGMLAYQSNGRQQVQAFRVGHTLAYTEEHGKRQALDNALNAWSPSKDYAAYCDAIAKAVEKSAVEVQDTLFGGIL